MKAWGLRARYIRAKDKKVAWRQGQTCRQKRTGEGEESSRVRWI